MAQGSIYRMMRGKHTLMFLCLGIARIQAHVYANKGEHFSNKGSWLLPGSLTKKTIPAVAVSNGVNNLQVSVFVMSLLLAPKCFPFLCSPRTNAIFVWCWQVSVCAMRAFLLQPVTICQFVAI